MVDTKSCYINDTQKILYLSETDWIENYFGYLPAILNIQNMETICIFSNREKIGKTSISDGKNRSLLSEWNPEDSIYCKRLIESIEWYPRIKYLTFETRWYKTVDKVYFGIVKSYIEWFMSEIGSLTREMVLNSDKRPIQNVKKSTKENYKYHPYNKKQQIMSSYSSLTILDNFPGNSATSVLIPPVSPLVKKNNVSKFSIKKNSSDAIKEKKNLETLLLAIEILEQDE